MSEPSIRNLSLFGCQVQVNDTLGHLVVTLDANVPWDRLWAIKNEVWGPETAAIEVHPPASMLVNNCPCRHLWRLGPTDFWPDLLGRTDPFELSPDPDSLVERYQAAWEEAWE